MNKSLFTFAVFSILLNACDDSYNNKSVQADSLNSPDNGLVSEETSFLDCDVPMQNSYEVLRYIQEEKSIDTVCFYKDFPIKDTICCYGEAGSWLERNENGEFLSVSGDYSAGFRYDTLYASIEPSSVHRCMATVGSTRYRAVKIGSQTWLSENAKSKGRCLNDEDENCKLFGSLMSYDKAKEFCSGDYRLPTNDDVEFLVKSVGAIVKTSYTKDVCGEIPGEVRYFEVPLFANALDSLNNNDAFGFSFSMKGGLYEKNSQNENLAYSTGKTCFFLQSDEKINFRNAFCYNTLEKSAVVTALGNDVELYVRCIMK